MIEARYSRCQASSGVGRRVRRPAGRRSEQLPAHEPPEDDPDADRGGDRDQPRPEPIDADHRP